MNLAAQELIDLGVIRPEKVQPYFPRVRDRDDIKVLRCSSSGVIFLDTSSGRDVEFYAAKPATEAIVEANDRQVPVSELEDAERRAKAFGDLIRGKRWLDFGAGRGTGLATIGPLAAQATGLEPNAKDRERASQAGFPVIASLDDAPGQVYDVITLFHVLEHLEKPSLILAQLSERLAPGGLLIIEVPHAKDALLSLFDSEPFRAFTLWSEHLVLHTRESMTAVMEAAGLSVSAIRGVQRYPVSNHLHWLRHGEPGGHAKWAFLDDPDLSAAYERSLAALDMTDTLVAYVRHRPGAGR